VQLLFDLILIITGQTKYQPQFSHISLQFYRRRVCGGLPGVAQTV
jgi:hypothetical protein